MKLPAFLSLLRIGRVLMVVYALASLVMIIVFIIRSLEIAFDAPPVKLDLDTSHPHRFFIIGEVNDIERGFANGKRGRRINLDSLYVPTEQAAPLPQKATYPAGFRLTSEARVRWLRYEEPNTWKRLGLYYLGASSRTLSLLNLVYNVLGCWLLLRLLLDVSAAEPFTAANARRLRYLALLVLGLFTAQQLAYGLIRLLIPPFRIPGLSQPLSHYALLNSESELPGLTVFVMLAIIAFVYQRGIELHQEAELTV